MFIKKLTYGVVLVDNKFFSTFNFSDGGDTSEQISVDIQKNIFGKTSKFILINYYYHFIDNTFEDRCDIRTRSKEETHSMVEIRSGTYNKGLYFSGTKDMTFPDENKKEHPHKNKISFLNIHCSEQLSGYIECKDQIIETFNMSGVNNRSNIVFSNILLEKLCFSDFTNLANIQFLSIIPEGDSELTIKKSYLGTTQFLGCEFQKLKKVSIQESIIQDIISVDTDWFTLKVLDPDLKTKNDFRNKREVFRQLKLAAEKQSDRIRSLQFKAQEYYSFEKELASTKGRYNDKFILWLSKTNYHGQNWLLPSSLLIILTIIIGIVMIIIHSPVLGFTPSFKLDDIKSTFSEIWTFKKAIIQIFNPIHKISEVFGEGKIFSGWLYSVDIAYRIIYAFLVFQIVSAFRKYVK